MHLPRPWMLMVGLLLAGGLPGYSGEPRGGPEAAMARIEKLGGSVAISGEYVYVSGETGPALSIFRLPPDVVEGPTSKKE